MTNNTNGGSLAALLASSRGLVVVCSILLVAGTFLYWTLASPWDAVIFLSTLSLSSVVTGVVLGYRFEKSEAPRPVVSAFTVAWRIGWIWVVIIAMVEFFLTDYTVGWTVQMISPYVCVAAFLMALSFLVAWVGRRAVVGMQTLSRYEKIQMAGIAVTLVGMIVSIALFTAGQSSQVDSEKELRATSTEEATSSP